MGRALTLFCDVGGIPPPELRWTKNGIPLDEGDNVEFGDGKRFVQIGNVSLGDRGVYRCEAINRAGNDTVEYRLDVYQVGMERESQMSDHPEKWNQSESKNSNRRNMYGFTVADNRKGRHRAGGGGQGRSAGVRGIRGARAGDQLGE